MSMHHVFELALSDVRKAGCAEGVLEVLELAKLFGFPKIAQDHDVAMCEARLVQVGKAMKKGNAQCLLDLLSNFDRHIDLNQSSRQQIACAREEAELRLRQELADAIASNALAQIRDLCALANASGIAQDAVTEALLFQCHETLQRASDLVLSHDKDPAPHERRHHLARLTECFDLNIVDLATQSYFAGTTKLLILLHEQYANSRSLARSSPELVVSMRMKVAELLERHLLKVASPACRGDVDAASLFALLSHCEQRECVDPELIAQVRIQGELRLRQELAEAMSLDSPMALIGLCDLADRNAIAHGSIGDAREMQIVHIIQHATDLVASCEDTLIATDTQYRFAQLCGWCGLNCPHLGDPCCVRASQCLIEFLACFVARPFANVSSDRSAYLRETIANLLETLLCITAGHASEECVQSLCQRAGELNVPTIAAECEAALRSTSCLLETARSQNLNICKGASVERFASSRVGKIISETNSLADAALRLGTLYEKAQCSMVSSEKLARLRVRLEEYQQVFTSIKHAGDIAGIEPTFSETSTDSARRDVWQVQVKGPPAKSPMFLPGKAKQPPPLPKPAPPSLFPPPLPGPPPPPGPPPSQSSLASFFESGFESGVEPLINLLRNAPIPETEARLQAAWTEVWSRASGSQGTNALLLLYVRAMCLGVPAELVDDARTMVGLSVVQQALQHDDANKVAQAADLASHFGASSEQFSDLCVFARANVESVLVQASRVAEFEAFKAIHGIAKTCEVSESVLHATIHQAWETRFDRACASMSHYDMFETCHDAAHEGVQFERVVDAYRRLLNHSVAAWKNIGDAITNSACDDLAELTARTAETIGSDLPNVLVYAAELRLLVAIFRGDCEGMVRSEDSHTRMGYRDWKFCVACATTKLTEALNSGDVTLLEQGCALAARVLQGYKQQGFRLQAPERQYAADLAKNISHAQLTIHEMKLKQAAANRNVLQLCEAISAAPSNDLLHECIANAQRTVASIIDDAMLQRQAHHLSAACSLYTSHGPLFGYGHVDLLHRLIEARMREAEEALLSGDAFSIARAYDDGMIAMRQVYSLTGDLPTHILRGVLASPMNALSKFMQDSQFKLELLRAEAAVVEAFASSQEAMAAACVEAIKVGVDQQRIEFLKQRHTIVPLYVSRLIKKASTSIAEADVKPAAEYVIHEDLPGYFLRCDPESSFAHEKSAVLLASILEKHVELRDWILNLRRAGRIGLEHSRVYSLQDADYGDRGGHRYYKPCGWLRWEIRVDNFSDYKNWPVAYHGTNCKASMSILRHGFHRPGEAGVAVAHGQAYSRSGSSIYFSPCIEYAAFPVYATLFELEANHWAQVVLQCRLRPTSFSAMPGSLTNKHWPKHLRFDRNFASLERLEWLVENPADVVVYGLMLREFGPSVDSSIYGSLATRVSRGESGPEFEWNRLRTEEMKQRCLVVSH